MKGLVEKDRYPKISEVMVFRGAGGQGRGNLPHSVICGITHCSTKRSSVVLDGISVRKSKGYTTNTAMG